MTFRWAAASLWASLSCKHYIRSSLPPACIIHTHTQSNQDYTGNQQKSLKHDHINYYNSGISMWISLMKWSEAKYYVRKHCVCLETSSHEEKKRKSCIKLSAWIVAAWTLLLTRQAVADQVQVLLNRCQHFVAGTVDGSFGTEAFVMWLVVKTRSRVNMLNSELNQQHLKTDCTGSFGFPRTALLS